jgi:RecA/RadA recombinase
MAAKKPPKKIAAPAAPLAPGAKVPPTKSLDQILESIMGEVGMTEQEIVYRPVATGINVLDYHNGRYFESHVTDKDIAAAAKRGETLTKDPILYTGLPRGKMIGIIGYTGAGKEQPVSSIVQTPSGPVQLGQLEVGDFVFGRDGRPTAVTGIFPQGVKTAYRVTFRDGTSTRAGAGHLWRVKHATGKSWETKTTSQLMKAGVKNGSGDNKYQVPLCEAVHYPEREHEFDPYLIGALIGDGSLTGSTPALSCTEADGDIVEPAGTLGGDFAVRQVQRSGGCPQYLISDALAHRHNPNRLKAELGRLGLCVLSVDKHIPLEYMYDSVENRTRLLQGLMDTDGTSEGNRISFSTTAPQLAADVQSLVRSLGAVAILRTYDRTDEGKTVEYVVNVRSSFNPFFSRRKAANWSPSTKNPPSKYIASIVEEGLEEQACIMVDAEDQLYLTDDYIVTHNTTLAIQCGMAIVIPYEGAQLYHIDLENAWSDERTADITGLPIATVKKIYRRTKPMSIERAYEFVKLVKNAKMKAAAEDLPGAWCVDAETGERIIVPTVIVLDTVAAFQTDAVMDENVSIGSALAEGGEQAKFNNLFAQRLAGMIGEANITIMWINHIRDKLVMGAPVAKRIQHLNAGESLPGGHGFPQYADYLLKVVASETLREGGDKNPFKIRGSYVTCTVVKTRLSFAGRQFTLVFTDNGFSNAWSNFRFLLDQKAVGGAGGNLFFEHPTDGRVTQKFPQSAFARLYEGEGEFREIVDAVLENELLAIVPQFGTPEEEVAEAAVDELAKELEGMLVSSEGPPQHPASTT